MDNNDKREFKDIMDGMSEYYGNDKLSVQALAIYFHSLADFSIDQVRQGTSAHITSATGQFYPKVADIIRCFATKELSEDDIIAQARLANTPVGILARIHIGTWDLQQGNSWQLKQRAAEVKSLLPSWSERAKEGQYSGHEITIMLKHSVDPHGDFAGQALPGHAKQLIAGRIPQIKASPDFQRMIGPPNSDVGDDFKPKLLTEQI